MSTSLPCAFRNIISFVHDLPISPNSNTSVSDPFPFEGALTSLSTNRIIRWLPSSRFNS